MTDDEAIEICESWFAHLARQAEKTKTLQQAAGLARRGEVQAARRLKNSVDRQPRVFDGARLEPAVRHLVSVVSAPERRDEN